MDEEIDLGRYGAETGLNMSAREPLYRFIKKRKIHTR